MKINKNDIFFGFIAWCLAFLVQSQYHIPLIGIGVGLVVYFIALKGEPDKVSFVIGWLIPTILLLLGIIALFGLSSSASIFAGG